MNEKNSESFEKLSSNVNGLYNLLKNRQLDHFSWCELVAEKWKTIAELWSKPEKASVFFIEHLFNDKWYISHYYSKNFYTLREQAEEYMKTITKNNENFLPLRVQGYAKVSETKKE